MLVNEYDRLVNDYARAVEEALAHLPASHRAQLLDELSERVAAIRSELNSDVLLDEILDSVDPTSDEPASSSASTGDSAPASDSASASASASDDLIELTPSRRLGALAWVLIVAATMVVACVGAAILAAFVLLRH